MEKQLIKENLQNSILIYEYENGLMTESWVSDAYHKVVNYLPKQLNKVFGKGLKSAQKNPKKFKGLVDKVMGKLKEMVIGNQDQLISELQTLPSVKNFSKLIEQLNISEGNEETSNEDPVKLIERLVKENPELANQMAKDIAKKIDDSMANKVTEVGGEVMGKSSPSLSQLIKVFIKAAIPMVGFGIVDNVIMVLFGDMIDKTIGVSLGTSVMFAAGLGNALSDSVGVLGGDLLEKGFSKLGFSEEVLSDDQKDMKIVKTTQLVGGAVGVFVGCIIGMAPLLFNENFVKLGE